MRPEIGTQLVYRSAHIFCTVGRQGTVPEEPSAVSLDRREAVE